MQEETVDMANVVFEERVQQRTVEQGAHMPGVDEIDAKIGTENGLESCRVVARNMHMVAKLKGQLRLKTMTNVHMKFWAM